MCLIGLSLTLRPRACALGYILPPLRGSGARRAHSRAWRSLRRRGPHPVPIGAGGFLAEGGAAVGHGAGGGVFGELAGDALERRRGFGPGATLVQAHGFGVGGAALGEHAVLLAALGEDFVELDRLGAADHADAVDAAG